MLVPLRYMRDSARPRKRLVGLRTTDTYSGYRPVTKRCRRMLEDFAIMLRWALDRRAGMAVAVAAAAAAAGEGGGGGV